MVDNPPPAGKAKPYALTGLVALLAFVAVLVILSRRTAPESVPAPPPLAAPAPTAEPSVAEEPAPPPAAEEPEQAPSVAEQPRKKKARKNDLIVEPVVVSQLQPAYPDIAKKMRLQGSVHLKAMIARDGRVESAHVVRGVHPVLDDAAVRAVRMWRYRPATLRGQAVPAPLKVKVDFKL